MNAGRVFLPSEVHLIDVVGCVALEEGIVGILKRQMVSQKGTTKKKSFFPCEIENAK